MNKNSISEYDQMVFNRLQKVSQLRQAGKLEELTSDQVFSAARRMVAESKVQQKAEKNFAPRQSYAV